MIKMEKIILNNLGKVSDNTQQPLDNAEALYIPQTPMIVSNVCDLNNEEIKTELSQDIYNARKYSYNAANKYKRNFIDLDDNTVEMKRIWDTALLKIHEELQIYGDSIADRNIQISIQ
eukprot:516205_1